MGLNPKQKALKRVFDIVCSTIGLVFTSWIIIIAWIIASFDTGKNGFFVQERVGQDGKTFKLIKIRSMRELPGVDTFVTTSSDRRITKTGRFMRKYGIDELPQLLNILKGDMSFVGPKPDVPGYADQLKGRDRVILSVRPGLTGPATLRYGDEEDLLAAWDDPESYSDGFIWPDKVKINREYVENWSFWNDLKYIWKAVFS